MRADAVHLVEHAICLAVQIALNAQGRKFVGNYAQVPSGNIAAAIFPGTVSHDLRRRFAFVAGTEGAELRTLDDDSLTGKIAGAFGTVTGDDDPSPRNGVFSQLRHGNILSHGKGILEEHHICLTFRLQIDADHIEPESRPARNLSQELAGNAGEVAPLVVVHGRLRRKELARGPGLDLNEAQRVAIPAHHVQLAVRARGAIVARDDYIAVPAQVEVSFFFSARPGSEMGCFGFTLREDP